MDERTLRYAQEQLQQLRKPALAGRQHNELLVPQEIIYNAWKNTEKPIIYETTDTKGNLIKKEVCFAVPEENKDYDESYNGLCNLCGQETHGGIPIKKMFSSKYMDWPIHKEPELTHICKACAFCVGMNPVGRIALFRYPLVAEKKLHICNRKQFREYLLNPPEPPFVMILPTSQKKHLFAKSRVSYSRKHYFCNLEEVTIAVDSNINQIMTDIEALRGAGFTKDNISSARIPWNVTKKYNLTCYDFENLILKMEKLHKSEVFGLALEVSQKMEEEKAECYLGLTPKMR